MTPSPFHGIFNTLSTGGTSRPEKRLSHSLPPPVSPPQSPGQVAVDIFEQDGYYVIKAPIAGICLQNLDIEINDTILTIRGRREQADTVPQDQYYLQECFWGEFSRSITLPTSIDPKKVRATFNKEGILKVIVPKEEKVKIVRISEG